MNVADRARGPSRIRNERQGEARLARQTVPVDAHVHLHARHSLPVLLDSAVDQFRLATGRPSAATAPLGALLLAEVRGVDVFDDLRSGRRELPRDGGWSVEATGEPVSLSVHRTGGERLILVRGRQIVTAEDLEVLALFSAATPPDGLPLGETVDQVRQSGALAVIPWGFGKWWRARGRLVRDLIEDGEPGTIFLGDNGCRPRFGSQPRLFELARRKGCRVLPGSDPLPLPGHQLRAGSYGFLVATTLDPTTPARDLETAIRTPDADLRRYGRRRSLAGFVRDQIAMQRLKRGSSRS